MMPNDPRVNPAGELANVERVLRRLAELEDTVSGIRERNYMRRATVSAFTAGSTTMTVTFAGGGAQATARYLVGYSPVVGHIGWVLCCPEANVFMGRDSVP